MPTHRDWHNDRPWMHLFQICQRSQFIWADRYLEPERNNFWLVYWNPTPGAMITWDGGEQVLDPDRLVVVPAGLRFQRRCPIPVDHWSAHVRVEAEPAQPAVLAFPVTDGIAVLLRQTWDAGWDLGQASPEAVAAAHGVVGWALAQIEWAPPGVMQEDQRLRELDLCLRRQGYPQRSNAALAQMVGMQEQAFCRWFCLRTGIPPQKWMRERRLERAAQLLTEGVALEQVVAMCGFTDRSHFTKLFRKKYKTTPGYFARLKRAHV